MAGEQNSVVSSYYMKLGETTPWLFKEGPGQAAREARVQVQKEPGNRFKLVTRATGKPSTEHEVEVTHGTPFFGQELLLLQSSVENLGTARWKSGLKVPVIWKVGETLSATSEAPLMTPLGPQHLTMTAQFVGFRKAKLPPWSPLPKTDGFYSALGNNEEIVPDAVIVIEQILKIAGGTTLGSLQLYCAKGLGVIRAHLEQFGVHTPFYLVEWTP
jgi:hypothetical protein